MIEDNQKEKWRVYNTSREFSKDLKFNRKWYHLIAIFDQDRGEDFDFNNDIEPGEEFDFNQVIEPIIYSSEDFVNTDEIEFDFNSPLMEKYKITEIGLIMGKLNEEQRFKISNTEQYPVENIVKGKNDSFVSIIDDSYKKYYKKYKKTGVFPSVTWSMDYALLQWFYETTCEYLNLASKIVDLEYHKLVYKDTEYTQLELIKLFKK